MAGTRPLQIDITPSHKDDMGSVGEAVRYIVSRAIYPSVDPLLMYSSDVRFAVLRDGGWSFTHRDAFTDPGLYIPEDRQAQVQWWIRTIKVLRQRESCYRAKQNRLRKKYGLLPLPTSDLASREDQ